MLAGAIGGVSGAGEAHRPTGTPPQMEEVAKLLGMSSSELSTELQSGKTLDGLASEKGVSSNELVKTIETELTAHKPEGAPVLSASQLTQMATNIAKGTPTSPPSGGGHFADGSGSTLAASLGIDPSELLEKLESGESLSTLLGESVYESDGSGTGQTSSTGVVFDGYA